jgi:hypothetical protein
MALAELAINNYNIASIKVSPFFLSYRYYIEPILIHKELCIKEGEQSLVA